MASYNGKGRPLVLIQVPVLVEVFEPYGRPFVPSPSIAPSSEVSNVMGIASQLFPTVLPSDIPCSSPSNFERSVMCLWQCDLPRDEVMCVPSLYPSRLPIEYLSLVLEEDCFEVSSSSASESSSQIPSLFPSDIPTEFPSDGRRGSAPMIVPSSNPALLPSLLPSKV